MFTGLKAINHFGRPDMNAFLKFIRKKHSYVSKLLRLIVKEMMCMFINHILILFYFQVSKVGVFSCGPSALTKTISSACESVNKQRKLPYFVHQFENF